MLIERPIPSYIPGQSYEAVVGKVKHILRLIMGETATGRKHIGLLSRAGCIWRT
jgi:hypothetical protein